jgi:hypothetical protein
LGAPVRVIGHGDRAGEQEAACGKLDQSAAAREGGKGDGGGVGWWAWPRDCWLAVFPLASRLRFPHGQN